MGKRKSINPGNGFRLTFSRAGVSGSWGRRGYRLTLTPQGKLRQTLTLPGSGLSLVSENGRHSLRYKGRKLFSVRGPKENLLKRLCRPREESVTGKSIPCESTGHSPGAINESEDCVFAGAPIMPVLPSRGSGGKTESKRLCTLLSR